MPNEAIALVSDPLCAAILRALGLYDRKIKSLTLKMRAGETIEVFTQEIVMEGPTGELRELAGRYRAVEVPPDVENPYRACEEKRVFLSEDGIADDD